MLPRSKKRFLLSIVVVSLAIPCLYLLFGYKEEETMLNFSPLMRIQVSNESSASVSADNWLMRFPPGTVFDEKGTTSAVAEAEENGVWLPFMQGVDIPPFSIIEENIQFSAQQSYPDLPQYLLNLHSNLVEGKPEIKLISTSFIQLEDVSDWVHSQIEYTGHEKHAKTIDQLLTTARGDCTEFTLLAYYRLRAAGYERVIPVEGYYFESSLKIDGSNEHAWLLVNDGQGWMVLDPLYKKFEKPSKQYLIMNLLKEGVSQPVTQNVTLPVRTI